MNKLELQKESEILKKRIYKQIVWFIIISILLIICQRYVQETTSEDDLKQYKYQCENYIKIEANIASTYNQLKLRRIANEVNINTFYYEYLVNGNTYQVHKTSLTDKPDESKIMVWYDKKNPSINTIDNPCESYNTFKKREISSANEYFLYVGMGCLLVLVFLLFSIIKTIGKIFFNSLEKRIKK